MKDDLLGGSKRRERKVEGVVVGVGMFGILRCFDCGVC